MTAQVPNWDITRIVLAVVSVIVLIATCLWLLKPFLPSTIWATMIVVATWPAMRAVQARLWGRRGLAVAVMTLIMLVVVVAPLAIATVTIVSNLDDIAIGLRSIVATVVSGPPTWVRNL